MPFLTFWPKNLQNSKGHEAPYKNTQIKYLTWGRIKLFSEAGNTCSVRANTTPHAILFKFGCFDKIPVYFDPISTAYF